MTSLSVTALIMTVLSVTSLKGSFMYINSKSPAPPWADRTFTSMNRRRFQACEKELAGLPQRGLFDPETTDAQAEYFYGLSWYSREEKMTELHTIEGLRARVLGNIPAEVALLSPEEHDLVVRAVLCGGWFPLLNYELIFPAVSIVRRLWGFLAPGAHGMKILAMPPEVTRAILISLASEEHQIIYAMMTDYFDVIDNTLYLSGIMKAESAMDELAFKMQGSIAADRPDLYLRMLRSALCTFVDREGKLYLIHPGLSDPQSLLDERRSMGDYWAYSRDAESLSAAYQSLADMEDPWYEQMFAQIQGLTRPGFYPENIVEDLILLVKQGAPLSDLRSVLSDQLACVPSRDMLIALSELHSHIPRWSTLYTGRLQ